MAVKYLPKKPFLNIKNTPGLVTIEYYVMSQIFINTLKLKCILQDHDVLNWFLFPKCTVYGILY